MNVLDLNILVSIFESPAQSSTLNISYHWVPNNASREQGNLSVVKAATPNGTGADAILETAPTAASQLAGASAMPLREQSSMCGKLQTRCQRSYECQFENGNCAT